MEGADNAAIQITQNTSKTPLGNIRISRQLPQRRRLHR